MGSVVITPIFDKDDSLKGFAEITRDMTVAKQIEQALQEKNLKLQEHASDLAQSNRDLETFSYSVSHDLRVPLRHVLEFLKALGEDAGPTLSAKSLGLLATIAGATKRMGNLIDDLLAFSRTGLSEMHKVKIDLNSLVRDALVDFSAETQRRNITWDISVLPVVQGDKALLRLVFVNLISNAVKFTGTRPAPRIQIGCEFSENKESVIHISDNGAGFDPEYADKLFGAFQRLHSQDEFEGTGLGLANIERIIRRHGGRVWAKGAIDEGATFYFSLPDNGKQ